MIFVAKHKETGLYSSDVKQFLMNNQYWMDTKKPSVEDVIQEMEWLNARKPLWTTDLQQAEVWSEYYINIWKKYLPNVEFVVASLTTSPK